jgi:hypothetical protein
MKNMSAQKPLFAFATQGSFGNDEARLRVLLEQFSDVGFLPYDYQRKFKSAYVVFKKIYQNRPSLVLMEGTGFLGGIAVILGRVFCNVSYVVSSGDAIAPFIASQAPLLWPLYLVYEKILTRFAAGFIGWTPYLSGRALTLGAKRVMTAPGWAPAPLSGEEQKRIRHLARQSLGIAQEALVIGIVGSLAWNKRVQFCYGYELVRAFERISRQDTVVLIVGEGTGRSHLEKLAGHRLGQSIILTGKVAREKIPELLSAMDIASLPQSVDSVGSFRYSTKLTEYMGAGLPILMGEVPMAYDLPGDWFWRIPGDAPWSETYVSALAALMDDLTPEEIKAKQHAVPRSFATFERDFQVERVTAFIKTLLQRNGTR